MSHRSESQAACRGSTKFGPAITSCSEDCPVEDVSWFEAVSYANALSSKGGCEPCYELRGESVRFVYLTLTSKSRVC